MFHEVIQKKRHVSFETRCIVYVSTRPLRMLKRVQNDVIKLNWWRGVVSNAFRLKRSYSTPDPISTAMGDCLRAGKPSRCEACQLGRLSLLPSVGR